VDWASVYVSDGVANPKARCEVYNRLVTEMAGHQVDHGVDMLMHHNGTPFLASAREVWARLCGVTHMWLSPNDLRRVGRYDDGRIDGRG